MEKYGVVLALNIGGSAYSMFNSIACFVFAVSSFTPIYNSHRSYARALAFSCLAALLVYFSVQGLMGKRGFQISIKNRNPRFCIRLCTEEHTNMAAKQLNASARA